MRPPRPAGARSEAAVGTFVPPGHYYSPIVDPAAVREHHRRACDTPPEEGVAGIDLSLDRQEALFRALVPYYADMPFGTGPLPGLSYHFDNPAYSFGDGIILHCMLRHLRPRRLIEVGSGYSSCVSLDTNRLYLDGAMRCTFIEPHPTILRSLVDVDSVAGVELAEMPVQEAPLSLFETLGDGDVLFIDSTHVSKTGSDTNYLVLDVLPRLAPGVVVHFHDIFYPFEYPPAWVFEENRSWNEAFLLRAFLTFNPRFEVIYFATQFFRAREALVRREMPLIAVNPGGNIWLRVIG